MDKEQALYFIEGLLAGFAIGDGESIRRLCRLVVKQYELSSADMDKVRKAIAVYLDEVAENGRDE